jgi:NADH-quinone oxidoreductase subunit M
LNELSGLFERIPFLAIAFLSFGLAIVGMPGTPGFDAAHLILEASIDSFGALSTVADRARQRRGRRLPALGFSAGFPVSQAKQGGHDVDKTLPMEYLVCGIALAAMLAIGFFTEPWLYLTETASQAMAARFVR